MLVKVQLPLPLLNTSLYWGNLGADIQLITKDASKRSVIEMVWGSCSYRDVWIRSSVRADIGFQITEATARITYSACASMLNRLVPIQ